MSFSFFKGIFYGEENASPPPTTDPTSNESTSESKTPASPNESKTAASPKSFSPRTSATHSPQLFKAKKREESINFEKECLLIPNYIDANEFEEMIQKKHIFTITELAKKSVFFESYIKNNQWLDLRAYPTIRFAASYTYVIATNQEGAEIANKVIQSAIRRVEENPDATSRVVFIALLKLKALYDGMVTKKQAGSVTRTIEEIFKAYGIPMDKDSFLEKTKKLQNALGY